MYFWLTGEYGAKNEGKSHKPQYTGIGVLYCLLAFVVGYEILNHGGHGDHGDHNKVIDPEKKHSW